MEQAARHCTNVYPNLSIEVEMGNLQASGTADITVASIWSLVSKDRLEKFDPSRFKLVLVDEAHHIVANSFMTVLKYFGLASEAVTPRSPALVGVSATMSRFDGLRLSDAIDHIVYHKDYVDMIEEKWLSNVVFTTVRSKANLKHVTSGPSGDFQLGQLSRAVNTPESNNITFQAWHERAQKRSSTLVFCVDLAHVDGLTSAFRDQGIDARYVTGETPSKLRSEIIDAFKAGQFPVLLNCGIFTEGTDIPNIDCILLARPTKSRNLLVQMIGRGMRLHTGKKDCHVIDMVASLSTGIVTVPTLLGLDPDSVLTEKTIDEARRTSVDQKAAQEERDDLQKVVSVPLVSHRASLAFTDYDSVYDLIDDTSSDRHIRSISRLAWVMVSPTRHILSSQDGSYLSLEQLVAGESATYKICFAQKASISDLRSDKMKSPYYRPRVIAQTNTSFSDAVHAADTFATKRFPWRTIHLGQTWRRDPASDSQIAFLNKSRPMGDGLSSDEVSKGKAADMITKLKFGAKGWFAGLEANKRKEVRSMDQVRKMQAMKSRETVQVGPLG